MLRPWLKSAAALVVALVTAAGPARAADAPWLGNWKVLSVSAGNEQVVALIQVEEKDGKFQAKLLSAPLLDGAAIDKFQADARSIQFEVKAGARVYHVKAYPAPKTKAVLGSILFNNQLGIARLDKTDDTDVKREDSLKKTPEGEALAKARTLPAKEQQAALKEIVEKNGDKPAAYPAGLLLLQSYAKDPPKDEEVRSLAEQLAKIGAEYGPEIEKHTIASVCQALSKSDKVSPVAVEFALKAEKSLTRDDTAADALKVLKMAAGVLRKAGKEDELKKLEPKIEKYERGLDAEFEKTAVPFKPIEYKGRRGDGNRVAVVELFTGAYCPPCVAADVAFDAALDRYKPKDVVFLQYHTHIPAPDRLTNTDTLARLKFYGKEIPGVPTCFLDGKPTKPLGGNKARGQNSYESLRTEIDEALETETTTALKLAAERNGDKIDITAEVSELKKPGEKVRLRIALVEEVVRYPGGNGQRLHHQVVRALPGGADGFAMTEAKAKQSVKVDLADLKKSLDEYMTTFNKGARKFGDDEYPLSMKYLKVVAFIQDDDSKEILQGVQIDVPDAK
jgi:hypothetical protein